MLRKLLLLLFALAATVSVAEELDGLDATMQVLDDVSQLENTLSALPTPDTLLGSQEGNAPAHNEADSQNGFDRDFVIEADALQSEDDFEEGEDIDDDRYDDI